MSGIWDRVVNRGDGNNPIGSNTLSAALYFAVDGTFTQQALVAALNATLRTPLTAAELADLSAILTQASAGTAIQKVDYQFKFRSLLIAAETRMLTSETTFRSKLGIT